MNEIKELFEYLADNAGKLRDSQLELIRSFKKYYRQKGELSEKQQKVLSEIRRNIQVYGMIPEVYMILICSYKADIKIVK